MLVVQTLVGVAETYYVSYLGTSALAGVTLVFPILMLMTMMSNGGIGGGVSSAVARAIGAGRKHDADALVTHALVLAIVFGLIFTVGVIWLGPLLYGALGGSGDALNAALQYSFYAFIGAVPAWIMNLFSSALARRGQCAHARHAVDGRRGDHDSAVARVHLRLRPDSALRHRRRGHRG